MPSVADQRWSCHSCGNCCRELVGHLFDADRERIDLQGWAGKLDVPPYVRIGRGWALNKRADGACVFLGENGLCRIHAECGEAAKPLACRIFPFSVREVGEVVAGQKGWQVSLRFDCPSVTSSRGRPIGEYHSWLAELVKLPELRKSESAVREPRVRPAGGRIPSRTGRLHAPLRSRLGLGRVETIYLKRGVAATLEETDEVLKRYTRWIQKRDLPITRRLVGAARVTTTLQGAKLKEVRGARFSELLDLLFGALPAESAVEASPPTQRQRGMLRQLVFAHCEHVTLSEMGDKVLNRLGKRWLQLRRSRRFLSGRGLAPRLPGIENDTTFEALRSVEPAVEEPERIENLLERYLTARLSGRSVFGEGYFGWPVFTGLAALWLSVASAGWLARYVAAADGRTTAEFEDVARAIRVVDRAATRLPALGTVAERTRVRYLSSEDGVGRLLRAYEPSKAARSG